MRTKEISTTKVLMVLLACALAEIAVGFLIAHFFG